MDTCDGCGETILFGGVRVGELSFCGTRCRENHQVLEVAETVPDDVLNAEVWKARQGPCPKCGGGGPVEAHASHRVWSAIAVTQWSSSHHVVCRPCGNRARLIDAGFSLLFGWWGFPWGFFITPVQIVRNLAGMLARTDPTKPSMALRHQIRLRLAAAELDEESRHGQRAA